MELVTILALNMCLAASVRVAGSEMNLYISSNEVQKLMGLQGELFYIRDGIENLNAIAYKLLVPESVSQVNFTWQDKQMLSWGQAVALPSFYGLAVSTNDLQILKEPYSSLSPKGSVPMHQEGEFSIVTPCREDVTGSGIVSMELNITSYDNGHVKNSTLKFSFLKLCAKELRPTAVTPKLPRRRVPPAALAQNEEKNEATVYIGIGVACLAIVSIAVATAVLHGYSMPAAEDEPKQELANDETSSAVTVAAGHLPPSLINVVRAERRRKETLLRLHDILISRNLLTIGNACQEGSFGRAYTGTLINADNGEDQMVLVKTVTEHASAEQVALFLHESSLLKRTTHHNVLPLMHVCDDGESPPWVIYPYMNRGNLKNFLRLSRTTEPLSKALTTRDIVYMAVQIARGLQYLARRRIVHKDVASRNCVVDEELHVKVCDNSLARDFFPGDYHCLGENENRPVRWMAAESLEFNKFLTASDVWSFGVLLWELTSLAQTPYFNVDPSEMLTYLKSGFRLPQPDNCPDDFFTVMACCWALSPEDRPHFPQIVGCLEAFLDTLNAFI